LLTALTRLLRALPYAGALRPRRGRPLVNLFDADYYLRAYPDVAAAGINPLLHFIVAGAFEGRRPHPLFDTTFYLAKYPDVAAARVNPLGHYLKRGAFEGRQPHPLFDSPYYLERNPEIRDARINPLVHYVLNGAAEGRKPHPLFQPSYYWSRCPEARRENPLVHFLENGHCSPHLLFDCESYIRDNPAVAANGINPLIHYVLLPLADARGSETPEGADLAVAHLDIDDVKVAVVFLNTRFGSIAADEQRRIYAALRSVTAHAGLEGEVAAVWRDRFGPAKFIAPPQQHPFFQSVNYDQLYAQINRTIRAPAAGLSHLEPD
jgi:hypothetical protein